MIADYNEKQIEHAVSVEKGKTEEEKLQLQKNELMQKKLEKQRASVAWQEAQASCSNNKKGILRTHSQIFSTEKDLEAKLKNKYFGFEMPLPTGSGGRMVATELEKWLSKFDDHLTATVDVQRQELAILENNRGDAGERDVIEFQRLEVNFIDKNNIIIYLYHRFA